MDLIEFFRIGMDRDIPQPRYPRNDVFALHRINLGIGEKVMPGGVVSIGLPEWNAEFDPIPYEDNTVCEVWALHFLEHVKDVLGVLRECHRVLAPGGIMNIVVPYGACHMYVHDLTHVHMFNEDTWRQTFKNQYYQDKEIPGGWRFNIGTNVIMGVKGENLALCTQLIRY
jgi:SAM-dependent methyltransferase